MGYKSQLMQKNWKCCDCYHNTSYIHNKRWSGWCRHVANSFKKSSERSEINGPVYNRVGLYCIFKTNSGQYTQLLYNFSTAATKSGGAMGACDFGNNLPINLPECNRRKAYVSWQITFKLVRINLSGTRALPFNYRYCGSHEHPHSRETQKQRKFYWSQSVSKSAKNWISSRKWGVGSCTFSMDINHIFSSKVSKDFGVLLREKGHHQPVCVYGIVRIHILIVYTDLIEYNNVGGTKVPLLHCFFIIAKLKHDNITASGQNVKYRTFSNLLIRPLLKHSFDSNHKNLRYTSREKITRCIFGHHPFCFDV